MPIKNGFEAAKEIMNIDKNAVIIFISADNTIEEKVLSLGVHDFLCKPIKMIQLLNAIERVLLKI